MNVPVAMVCAVLFSAGATATYTLWDAAPETGLAPEPQANSTAEPAGGKDAGASHNHGVDPRVEALDGKVPTLLDATTELTRRPRIVIQSDADFNPANGIAGGTGTPDDPFIFENLFVDVFHVADTSRHFVLRNSYVANILILDWVGEGPVVHHNHIENLRTNRNVERTGDATAGIIAKNEIARIQELRHFDGAVVQNRIGDPDALPLLGPDVVFNIAGFNGAEIHHNEIFGGVDMKLHGHHHANHHGMRSHNHGDADEAQNETMEELHAVRHITFDFHHNVIRDDGFGMRWNDLNHAGDDRQATSEQEPALEQPHYHYTTILLRNNTIDGASVRVTIFNAPDELHLGNSGRLVIENNTLTNPAAGNALTVQDVRDAEVELRGNVVKRENVRLTGTSGIHLLRFKNSTVLAEDNVLNGYKYGIQAREFDANTTWHVKGLRAPGAEVPVYWDNTVANPPGGVEGEAADAHAGHDHDHGGKQAADAAPVAEAATRFTRLRAP